MRYIDPKLAQNYKSTFISSEKDQEAIWKKLFVESYPYSDKLKRLLIINTPDCLDETQYQYAEYINKFSLKDLRDKGYLRVTPRYELGEHEEAMAYILLSFDDFVPTSNPQYRDCTIYFTIICNLDHWELDDYKIRPLQIAGYIDGILNEARLSGIGTLHFMGASQIVFNENLGGVMLGYLATHGEDDVGDKVESNWPSPDPVPKQF